MANTRSGGGAAGSGARREGHTTVPSTAAAAPTKPPNARETRSTTGTAATNAQTPNLRRSTRENKGKNRYKQVPATLSSHRSATRPTTATTAVATSIPMSSPNKTTKLRNTSISPSPPISQDSSGTSTSAPTPAATKRKAEEDVQTVTTASKKQRRPMSTKEFRTLFNPEEKHSSPVLATSPTEDKKNTSEVQAEDGDAVLVYEASSAQEKEQASREPSSVAGSHQSDLVSEPCMPIETCSLNKAAEIVSILEAGEQDAGDSNQNSLPELRNRACSTDHHEEASKAIEDVDSIGIQGPCTSRHSETIHCDETDYDGNMCVGCKIRETSDILKSCDGKGCKRRYHLSCMDPPFDVSLGIWLCIICTKKRLQFGVYSVSEGIESLWDVKEGVDNSKQYFVKYKNLAHVHNRWVSESDIVDSTPQDRDLISKFSKRIHKEKTIRWRQEWAEPHRLLKKRALMPPKEAESFFNSLGDKFVCCNVEWLVKWKDLGYEHATWELEASSFLCTPEAQELKRSYVNRIEAARKSSDPAKVDKVKEGVFQKLQRLPDGCPPGLDDDHLSSLNQLREFWYNSHGAVLIDDQERVIKTILFVASILPHISQPLLIVSTSASLSLWETKFSRLAAAINVVVYNGEKDVRQSIQNLEFYEDGSVMFQVLLTHPDAVFEDIEAIEQISWETVIVDDCQNSRVSKCLEQLKRLPTSFRMVLLSSSLKENIPEYMNLLSFLNPEGNGILSVSNSISFNTAGTLAMLKTKLASYVAFERKATKFSEYWVPARLSTVQLELYCYTLLSNSPALRSHSKTDNVGALRNILVSLRKCCDHPYLVDQMLQSSLTKGHPVTDILDIGVRSCGKLLLLDKMLQKIRIEGLRVLILSQSGGGSANPMGDILDDFIRQRFGYESYERVERGLQLQKKQTSMNMFNDKTKGRFIFLIDSRACGPSIKLSSVDAIIIYSSDWNPVNDLRALQRVTMESQSESVPVFRLYSSCTVEEKALILAKHDHILDSNIQNITPSLSHSLLSWGASLLFNRLEECQNPSYSSKGANDNELFMDNVALEFLTKLPKRVELSTEVDNGAISKAYLRGSFYSRDIVVVGEREGISSIDGDLPKFWAYWLSLLNGRSPCWQHISEPAQRSRRKIQNMEGQSKNTEEQLKAPTEETDEARIKRRRIGEINDSSQKSLPGKNKDTILPENNTSSSSHQIAVEDTWQELERNYLDVTQKGLHIQLKPELSKLYKLLQLPENVISLCEELLEYILKNHQISQEPKGILHAFNLAMCWRAASLLKHKVNHTESLTLAMKNLNYECSEELAEFVHGKLKILKRKFARRAGETSKQNHTASMCKISTCEQETSEKLGNDELKSSQVTLIENDPHQEDTVDIWTEEMVSGERELLSDPGTRRKECLSRDELLSRIMNKRIKLVDKAFFLRRKSIQVKHSNEVSSLDRHRQKEVAKLREACSLVVDHLRRRQNHIDQEDRDRKVKCTIEWFTMLLYAFLQHMRCQRNRLEMMQSATWTKESQLKEETLQAAKSGQLDHTFDQRIPLPDSEFAMEEFSHFREVVGSCHVHEAAPSPELLDGNSAVEITLVPSVNALEVIEEVRNIPAEVSIQGPAPQTASLSVNVIRSISDGSQGDAPLAVQSLEPSGGDHRSAEHVEEGTVGSPLQGDAAMEVNTGNRSTASASSPHFERPASSASREATFPVSSEIEGLSNLVTQCAQQSLVSSQLLQGEPEQADLSGGASTQVLQSESQQTISVSSNLLERAQADESQPSYQTDAPPCSVQSAELQSEGQPSIPVYNNLLERTQPDQSQPIHQTPGSVQSAELRSEGQPSIPVYNNLLERTQPDQSQPIHQTNAAPGSVQSAELFPVASMMFNHPPIDAEPLKNELHKLRLHMDTLNKVREMKKAQLRTECSIEIEKVKRKYDLLIEEHESTHLQQKKAFDDFYDKVLRNQSLAEDFRAKFISASATQGAARVQTPPIRRTPQSSQQIPMRPSVVGSLASPSALPSAYRQPAPRPRVQAPQADQPSLSPSPLSHPSLPSSQVAQPPPFISSNLFRATSGTLSPIPPPRGNYGVQGESAPRAPAPHLQLRPPRAHSIPPGNQQQLPTTRVEITSSALAASSSPPGSHLTPLGTSATSTLHSVLPSPGSNIARPPSITAGTRLSDSTLSLDAWLTASLGLSSDAPRGVSAPVTDGPDIDVVCLSDDEE